MLRLDDLLADRFRVDARIAEGGMGLIYRGFDLETDQKVAIKVLQPGVVDSATRFAREATVLATIEHPGIVRYVAHGVSPDGAPYLVMQWLEGRTLREHAAEVGLTPGESVATVRAVAEALGTAHARGLVHRDIKPDNIILAGGDLARPTVIDFGLARSFAADARLTETGTVVGTPGYMAPEQARGERDLDARTDVFALGCLLYECLLGVPAFGGRNAAAVLARIVLCEPTPLDAEWPDAPRAIEVAVRGMLAKARDNRPAGGAAVAALLAAIEVPDGPRRRHRGAEETSTRVVPAGTPGTHVIYVQGPAEDEPIARALAALPARAERLADELRVIVVDTDPAAAERAAECARALEQACPQALIAVASPDQTGAPPLAALLDAAAGELEAADLARIFRGGPTSGTVHVVVGERTKP
jgi:hypothetical protein